MLSVFQRSSLFLFTVPGLPGAETQNVAACVWPTCVHAGRALLE